MPFNAGATGGSLRDMQPPVVHTAPHRKFMAGLVLQESLYSMSFGILVCIYEGV